MGFFSKLKGQVLYQQQLELVCLEACEQERELQPNTLKNCIRLCVARRKEMNYFSQDLAPNYRDVAYIDLISLLRTLFDEALNKGNNRDASDIYNYLDTLLSVAEVQHLKLSDGLIKTALEIRSEIGKEIVDETDQVADMRLYAKLKWKKKKELKGIEEIGGE